MHFSVNQAVKFTKVNIFHDNAKRITTYNNAIMKIRKSTINENKRMTQKIDQKSRAYRCLITTDATCES